MALLRPYFLGKVALGVPLDCHERLLVAGGWRGGFWGDDGFEVQLRQHLGSTKNIQKPPEFQPSTIGPDDLVPS